MYLCLLQFIVSFHNYFIGNVEFSREDKVLFQSFCFTHTSSRPYGPTIDEDIQGNRQIYWGSVWGPSCWRPIMRLIIWKLKFNYTSQNTWGKKRLTDWLKDESSGRPATLEMWTDHFAQVQNCLVKLFDCKFSCRNTRGLGLEPTHILYFGLVGHQSWWWRSTNRLHWQEF